MTLFPLDALRNAAVDRAIEPVLEQLREDIKSFPFSEVSSDLVTPAVLEAFDMARARLNVLASLLGGDPGASSIDVGTGIGFLPVLLEQLGFRVRATDRDPRLSRFAAERGIEVRPYTIGRDNPPFPPASTDCVVLAEVLEHLKVPPIRAIEEVATMLRSGGRFLLTTPNVTRLSHLEALMAGENFLEPFPEETPADADPTDVLEHVREYSVREGVDAMEGAGLEITDLLTVGWGDTGYDPPANPWVNDVIVISARK